MEEIWKDIPDWENLYQISSIGRIKSVRYNKFRKSVIGIRGYHTISLWNKRFNQTLYVHRLLAQLFIENPDNKTCVNHKDGNKLNNNLNNLEWVTYSENNKHAFDTGLKISNNKFGTQSKRGIFNKTDLHEIKNMVNSGLNNKQIAEKFQVDSSTIQKIVSGKHYKGEY